MNNINIQQELLTFNNDSNNLSKIIKTLEKETSNEINTEVKQNKLYIFKALDVAYSLKELINSDFTTQYNLKSVILLIYDNSRKKTSVYDEEQLNIWFKLINKKDSNFMMFEPPDILTNFAEKLQNLSKYVIMPEQEKTLDITSDIVTEVLEFILPKDLYTVLKYNQLELNINNKKNSPGHKIKI